MVREWLVALCSRSGATTVTSPSDWTARTRQSRPSARIPSSFVQRSLTQPPADRPHHAGGVAERAKMTACPLAVQRRDGHRPNSPPAARGLDQKVRLVLIPVSGRLDTPEHLGPHGAEPRLTVGKPPPGAGADRGARQRVAQPTVERHARPVALPDADHDVDARERREKRWRERRIMLAVGVDGHDRAAPLGQRRLESRPQRRALPAIVIEPHDVVGDAIGDLPRLIRRAIIDHDDAHPRDGLAYAIDHLLQRLGGVVRRDDACGTQRYELAADGHRLSSDNRPTMASSACSRPRRVSRSSADRAAARSVPLPARRCSSTFRRAPSIVYFSVYRRCLTSKISSTSRRWYTRLPERFLAGLRKRNWLSQYRSTCGFKSVSAHTSPIE